MVIVRAFHLPNGNKAGISGIPQVEVCWPRFAVHGHLKYSNSQGLPLCVTDRRQSDEAVRHMGAYETYSVFYPVELVADERNGYVSVPSTCLYTESLGL